jgi:hypothetical protein
MELFSTSNLHGILELRKKTFSPSKQYSNSNQTKDLSWSWFLLLLPSISKALIPWNPWPLLTCWNPSLWWQHMITTASTTRQSRELQET